MRSIDLVGKSVLDLGCGGGDMLQFAAQAGAVEVWGVDNDVAEVAKTLGRIRTLGNVYMVYCSIDNWFRVSHRVFDVVMCLSVLPYVDDFYATLKLIADHSHIAIIECQYHGDGPGPYWLRCDVDMSGALSSVGFNNVTKLGSTEVLYRNTECALWRAETV